MTPNNPDLQELKRWLAIAQQPYAPRFKAARQDAYRMVVSLVPAILDRAEAERDELREESAYIKQQLEWVEENGDTYTKESLVDFVRRTVHALDHTAVIKEAIAARDARMKREGAAEWLEQFAKKDAFEKLAYLQGEKLTAEAKRLRERE